MAKLNIHILSANDLGLVLIFDAISFTYDVNKIGASTDPCGAPLVLMLRLIHLYFVRFSR